MTTIEQVAQVVDRAVRDPDFRERLTSTPADTLRGEGINVPAGAEVTVLENTKTLRCLIRPPDAGDMSDADLAALPAGFGVRAVDAVEGALYLVLPPAGTTGSSYEIEIGSIGESITKTLEAVAKLITLGAYLAGFKFLIRRIIQLKQHGDDPFRFPIATSLALELFAFLIVILDILDQPSDPQSAEAAASA